MKKIDATVLKETKYILFWTLGLSVLMQSVFLIIRKWDYTVLLGNLLSCVAAVSNFFLLGITLQATLNKEEKPAKKSMTVSRVYRFLLLCVLIIVGVVLPCFSTWTVIIPIFFPRIAIAFRPLFNKKMDGNGAAKPVQEGEPENAETAESSPVPQTETESVAQAAEGEPEATLQSVPKAATEGTEGGE